MERISLIREYADVNDPMYNEAHALNALYDAMLDAYKVDELLMEDPVYKHAQFTVTIAGTSVAFYVGGPQMEALHTFIKHIADENMYGKSKDDKYLAWGEEDE